MAATSAGSAGRRGAAEDSSPAVPVSVILRVRPSLPHEAQHGHCTRVAEGRKVVLTTSSGQGAGGSQVHPHQSRQRSQVIEGTYDKVLDMMCSQEDVWQAVRPAVDKALDGYNATLFTYGMTGTGKTYSMLGPRLMGAAFEGRPPPPPAEMAADARRGIVPRVVQRIFDVLGAAGGMTTVVVSYMQIYRERCYDLLVPATVEPLRIREDSAGVAYAEGLSQVVVPSAEACYERLLYGFCNIAFRSTAFNEQSSRSHAVMTLTVQRCAEDGRVRRSRIHLVDLAGNERWDTFGAGMEKNHARELISINRSLHTLGACVQALSQPPAVSKRDGKLVPNHVPFRDSALTLLLRDSLSGNSFVTMVCTVCSCALYQVQTLCTLRFADRAKRMQLKARRAEALDEKAQLESTKAEITYLRSLVAEGGLQEHLKRLEYLNSRLQGENKNLKAKVDLLSQQVVQAGQRGGSGDRGRVEEPPRPQRLRRAISEPALLLESCQLEAGDEEASGMARTSALRDSRPLPWWAEAASPPRRCGRRHESAPGCAAGASAATAAAAAAAAAPGGQSCSQRFASQLEVAAGGRSGGVSGCRRPAGMAARCPLGHTLVALGSATEPLGTATYAEWQCDASSCSNGSIPTPGLCRYHCASCQHDICEECFFQLAEMLAMDEKGPLSLQGSARGSAAAGRGPPEVVFRGVMAVPATMEAAQAVLPQGPPRERMLPAPQGAPVAPAPMPHATATRPPRKAARSHSLDRRSSGRLEGSYAVQRKAGASGEIGPAAPPRAAAPPPAAPAPRPGQLPRREARSLSARGASARTAAALALQLPPRLASVGSQLGLKEPPPDSEASERRLREYWQFRSREAAPAATTTVSSGRVSTGDGEAGRHNSESSGSLRFAPSRASTGPSTPEPASSGVACSLPQLTPRTASAAAAKAADRLGDAAHAGGAGWPPSGGQTPRRTLPPRPADALEQPLPPLLAERRRSAGAGAAAAAAAPGAPWVPAARAPRSEASPRGGAELSVPPSAPLAAGSRVCGSTPSPRPAGGLASGAPLAPLGLVAGGLGQDAVLAAASPQSCCSLAADEEASRQRAARSVAAAQQLAALHARLGLDALLAPGDATAAAAEAAALAGAGSGTAATVQARRATPPLLPPSLASFGGIGALLGELDSRRSLEA